MKYNENEICFIKPMKFLNKPEKSSSINLPQYEINIAILNYFLFSLGLLAKKAVEAGLTMRPYIKTSLSPGSGVVTYYLKESGVMEYLEQLGLEF